MQNNNIISRPSWEVFIGEQNKVTTVGRLLNSTLKPVDALYQETKAKINKAKHDNSTHYLRCCYCNSNLYGRRSQQNTKQFTYYFCHHTPTDDAQREKILSCPYYTGTGSDLYNDYCSDIENEWRTNNKYNVIEALESSSLISIESIVNNHFIFSKDDDLNTRRKPDIYFEDLKGNKWVVEFYRSWITTDVVYSRESFFRKKSINLLWLFPSENKFNSESIADYIMFGSNNAYLSIRNNHRPANNVFYFDENELQSTINNNELTVLTRYPKISVIDNNRVEVEFLTKEALLSAMSLDPGHRLPWAVDTKYNYAQYRGNIAHRLTRLRKAYRYCKTHLSYNEVSPRILSSLDEVILDVHSIDYNNIDVEKTINRYILRLRSYSERSGASTIKFRNTTAKLLKSAYALYRTLKSKPLRKIKEKEVNDLVRLCYLINNKDLSSSTYNNIQTFQRDLVTRFELFQQQRQHRGKEAEALIQFRKLCKRMRSYDLFPINHLTKVNEIRHGLEFLSISSQTAKILTTKNGQINAIILKTKRHNTAKNVLLILNDIKAINDDICKITDILAMNVDNVQFNISRCHVLISKLTDIKQRLLSTTPELSSHSNQCLNNKIKAAKLTLSDISKRLSERDNHLQLRISEFYSLRKEIDIAISQANTHLDNLENIIKSNYSTLKEYNLIRSYVPDIKNIENELYKCIVTNNDYLIMQESALIEFNNAKTSCESLLDDWWHVFNVIRNEADELLYTQLDELNDSIDTLIVKIRSGDCNKPDLAILYDKGKNVTEYISNDPYLSSKIKQSQFKWSTAYAEAYRLLNPVQPSNTSTVSYAAVSNNAFKKKPQGHTQSQCLRPQATED
ncbi:hypothetical protein [Photobacterium kishitanii]|uniref:competence protein CoiA family protein n=1 Tax=Photobacterium kishitanii TaxID=318456 RepID=UPI0007F891D3|nr:hypothetical protein [Photobacterium kishitanii]OBU30171.1 hypothetical protein AYY23_21585 [Photobacterium kishitanii]